VIAVTASVDVAAETSVSVASGDASEATSGDVSGDTSGDISVVSVGSGDTVTVSTGSPPLETSVDSIAEESGSLCSSSARMGRTSEFAAIRTDKARQAKRSQRFLHRDFRSGCRRVKFPVSFVNEIASRSVSGKINHTLCKIDCASCFVICNNYTFFWIKSNIMERKITF
jgi:hypothetical protein